MTTQLRVLDDGAWVSVDNRRQVATTDVWPFVATDFCSCSTAFVLLEAFTDVGVDGREVVVDGVGRCVDCGEKQTFAGLGVGRVLDGSFRAYPPDGVRATSEPVV
ncbi:hypothetical protein G9C85_08650 [Halorubellus sp. JP-L1]|uniref:hypothetical protein n=1 Tax=Halorubellus sp. JP-L1 TaxID=2715753 RepID=UPI00140917DD|nr:hypothetical protein [Halorubellus sp. JP-L1]NHN41701.1 hypothetical protein [Halorubellus sp. JP-L1]